MGYGRRRGSGRRGYAFSATEGWPHTKKPVELKSSDFAERDLPASDTINHCVEKFYTLAGEAGRNMAARFETDGRAAALEPELSVAYGEAHSTMTGTYGINKPYLE